MSALTEHLMDSIAYLKTKSEQLAAVVDTLTEDIKSLTADNADLINQRSQHLRMLKQRERRIDELLPLEETADEQHSHLTEDLRETRRQLKDAKEWNEVSSKGLHTMIETRDNQIENKVKIEDTLRVHLRSVNRANECCNEELKKRDRILKENGTTIIKLNAKIKGLNQVICRVKDQVEGIDWTVSND